MRKFQDTFETPIKRKRSLISAFSISMTVPLTNILLAEIGNRLLSFFSKSKCKLHENLLSIPKIISMKDQKSLQYIAGCVVHKLYICQIQIF